MTAVQPTKYTGRRVNLIKLASSFFAPFIFAGTVRASLGCGAVALSLMTGIAPEKIAIKNKTGHYPDKFMIGYLRRRGYRVVRLTQCLVSSTEDRVRTDHVVLLSQLFRKNEATWGVLYNEYYWHNYAPYTVSSISFLNKPILSAYIVSHAKWRYADRDLLPAARHPKPKKTGAITWAQLEGLTNMRRKLALSMRKQKEPPCAS
jgi:hypothetical protein